MASLLRAHPITFRLSQSSQGPQPLMQAFRYSVHTTVRVPKTPRQIKAAMRVAAFRRKVPPLSTRFRMLLVSLAAPSFLTDFSNPRGEHLRALAFSTTTICVHSRTRTLSSSGQVLCSDSIELPVMEDDAVTFSVIYP